MSINMIDTHLYEVVIVAAIKGNGTPLYELTMMHLHNKGASLVAARDGNVRGGAERVWNKLHTKYKGDMIDITDDSFSFDIIDETPHDVEERREWFSELDDDELIAITQFNTPLSTPPSSQYQQLIRNIPLNIDDVFNDGQALKDELYE